jgi:Spy/CpxP family protein refolding chaperone
MKRYIALPILALFLLTVAADAKYHGKGGWNWWDNEATVKELGITPEQKTKLKEVQEKYQPALDKAVKTYEEKKEAYWTLKSDPESSKADVIKAFDVMWDAKYKMKRIDLDRKLDAKAVLTPEQVTKLQEIRKQHKKQMKERIKKRWKDNTGNGGQ